MSYRFKDSLLFPLFFVLTVILYSNTIHSKFVFDFIDIVFDFQKRGWGDLGNFSKGFHPYFTAKFIFFSLLKILRFNVYGWYIVTCLLHALNAFLLFRFMHNILQRLSYEEYLLPAVFTAVVFLVSPYHTEVIVWGGALNYLIVSFFIFIHLNAMVSFIVFNKTSSAIIASISFLAAVFSHEWGLFLIPADLLLFFSITPDFKKIKNRKHLLLIIAIISITICYFVNQLIRGQLIGHYGAETHLNFKLNEIIPAVFKYTFKILLFSGFWGEGLQTKIYMAIQRPLILYSLLLVLIFFVSASFWTIWKGNKKLKVPTFFFLLFCLFVFPVLNLYFPYWISIQADRYCYLPTAFLCAGCFSILFLWKSFLKFIVLAVFICFSIFFLYQDNFSWNQAGALQQKLESSFRWWDARRVYILNMPDNFRGAYMYRGLQPSAFAGSFIKYEYLIPQTEIIEVLNYNLNATDDSVTVEKISDHQLKVTLSKWGIWWWRNTLGATDYETELIKVDVDDAAHSYLVEFKQKKGGEVFLYQANGIWREIKDF